MQWLSAALAFRYILPGHIHHKSFAMNSQNQSFFLAIALSAIILLGFHHFYEVPREQALEQAAAAEQAKAGGDKQIAGTGDSPAAQVSTLNETAPARSRQDVVSDKGRIAVKNPRLYGSIATTGIKIDDLTFTDYYTALDHQSHVDLLSPSGTEAPYYASFGWVPADAKMPVPDAATHWTVDKGTQELTPDHPVAMSWDNGKGLVFQRTLSLDENYMFTIADTVKNNTGEAVTLYPYATVVRQGTPTANGSRAGYEGALGILNNVLAKAEYSKLKDNKLDADVATQTSQGGWLGFSDKYWLVAAVPEQSETITAEFRHSLSSDTDVYQTDYRAGAKSIAAGGSISQTSHLFAGAKQVHLLEKYRDDLGIPRLEFAVDWGWFRFLTKPFFYGIDFLAKSLGNFGLGILAFTIVVRILIFPLAWKTFREMNRMSDLGPKLNAIKAKHGPESKEAMQAEVMELYQKEKVNPISGCLPMLLQIPIFFSLFKVLSTTIEMRQQPFYGYIHDLSVEDPTNVFTLFGLIPEFHANFMNMTIPPHLGLLPLLLGVSMLLLQLNGPKPADPVQAKAMLINPIAFTFIMAHLPVGLVIYYIWSNTLSIGQQRFIRWFYRQKYPKTVSEGEAPVPEIAVKHDG